MRTTKELPVVGWIVGASILVVAVVVVLRILLTPAEGGSYEDDIDLDGEESAGAVHWQFS
jgi:hypothetical protein